MEKSKLAQAAEQAAAAPERIVYKLTRPFAFNGVTLTELTFREPMICDIYGLSQNDPVKAQATLIARLTGVNVEDIERLPLTELVKMNQVAAPFLSQWGS